jgi:GNAT superfamily N-acetyltransferase
LAARVTGTPRPAAATEIAALADLWDHLWHVAHSGSVPPELEAIRTRADFLRRLRGFGTGKAGGLRVIGPAGAPTGFAAVVGNHLDQLYVAEHLWGSGAAQVLADDALARIAAAGHDHAILECNAGNDRAAAYYRKSGWRDCGLQTVLLDSARGPFPLGCYVFEMPLDRGPLPA